jgi:hypothetical protein
MSSTHIRHGSTAQAAATQRTEHDPKHSPNHGHGHRANTGHGQYGGYVFRPGRNPAPPVPRRAGQMRPRQNSPTAQSGGAEQAEQHDPMGNVPARAGTLDDEHRPRAVNMEGTSDDASHDESGQRESRSLPQLRMRPEPTPSAKTLESLLEQLCGSPAQALCRNAGTSTKAEHAQALLNTLLAIASPAMASVGTKLSGEALKLMAVRAYVLNSRERGAFATLERVKQVLVEMTTSARTQGARATPPSEKEQDQHLLLPLTLLNADRPRTPEQSGQTCDRMELLSASRHMQRAHP